MAGGGAERVQLEIMRHLVEAGHDVDLILAFGGGVLLPLVPPQVRVIELRASRLARSFPGLLRYLKQAKPWSLHAIMWPCTVIAVAARLAARSSTKLLLSEHIALSKQYPSARQHLMLKASMQFSYPQAEHIVAVSNGAARDVERLASLEHGRVEVIYNPMDLPSSLPDPTSAQMDWGDGGPRLITLGRLSDQKNHALLIEAFKKVLDRIPNATLTILGDGPLRGALEEQCRRLELSERVRLPGFVVDPWPWLVSANLFVLSSDYEGMSLVLVEAMHAGLRVVSTDCVAGPAELLADGRYGVLSPVGDAEALAQAILKALETPAEPERQRARAAEITGAANLQRYADLLTA